MNWKDVPIPDRMAHLPRDARGYPVPYTILMKNGVPQFTVNSSALLHRCMLMQTCGICGGPLVEDMWLIGGPEATFFANGCYLDPAVHRECGSYALQVCPYLAAPNYLAKEKENKKSPESDIPGALPIIGRPPFFMMVKTSGFAISISHPVKWLIHPVRPFLETIIWKGGMIISARQALEIWNNLNIDDKR